MSRQGWEAASPWTIEKTVGDIEATVLVDSLSVWRSRDVEGIFPHESLICERQEMGDELQLVLRGPSIGIPVRSPITCNIVICCRGKMLHNTLLWHKLVYTGIDRTHNTSIDRIYLKRYEEKVGDVGGWDPGWLVYMGRGHETIGLIPVAMQRSQVKCRMLRIYRCAGDSMRGCKIVGPFGRAALNQNWRCPTEPTLIGLSFPAPASVHWWSHDKDQTKYS